MEAWPPQELDRAGDRMVAFAVAAIQGRTRNDAPPWADIRELVATSPDLWEASSRPK
jgi:hypothetical protein